MEHRDAFSACHPAVNFLYFTLVIAFTMFLMQPWCLLISLACALTYHICLRGLKGARAALWYLLPTMGMAAVLNPAFNHEGTTVLAHLPSGAPLTLESVLYGLAAAVMLAAVITWFACYTEVMTSDKFIYLFGRLIPSLSLVLSMALRFVPRFKAQFHAVREAQEAMGRGISHGKVSQRLKNAVTILSILVTWALENAVATADSMKSRGYGLPGRTAFSIYPLTHRDKLLMTWLCACGAYLLCGWAAGGLSWRWFPSLDGASVTPLNMTLLLAYLALCLTPVLLDRKEAWTWARLHCEM